MRQGIGDQSAEQSLRRQAELRRLLAAAEGYPVVASDGMHLGWLEHRARRLGRQLEALGFTVSMEAAA